MMALMQMTRRIIGKSFLIAVVFLSIASFLTFTSYTSLDTSDLTIKLEIRRNKDSEFVHHLAQSIRVVEEKITINNHNRTSFVSTTSLPNRQTGENFHENLSQNEERYTNSLTTQPNYNVHIFYYPWYKNEKVDGNYAHWNHEFIPHWNSNNLTRKRQHVPPDDIGANYYPKLGPYSSADPIIIDAHMKQIRSAGTGVLSVSWYPPHYEGSSETPVDNIMMKLLDAAAKYELKIAFHLEPFKHRDGQMLKEVVKYVLDTYGNHSAFYYFESNGRKLPVFYVYDSYQIKPQLWAGALTKGGKFSVRNTRYDAIFLGLLVEFDHFNHLTESGFDGFYTYFASNGFVYGSTWANWPKISVEAKRRNLIFVPSIGPGYLDTQVRSWNEKNTKLRLSGRYYKSAFKSALAVKPALLTITSFNEWHEGTQVEPAIPKTIANFKYEDYQPNSPEFYLNLTRCFAENYHKNMTLIKESYEHADTL